MHAAQQAQLREVRASRSRIIAATFAPLPALVVGIGILFIGLGVARQSKKVKKGSSKSLKELGSSVQVLTQMFQGANSLAQDFVRLRIAAFEAQ